MGIKEQIKHTFQYGSVLSRLIYINVGVFLLVNIIRIPFFLFNASDYSLPVTAWLAVPADPLALLYRPWTLITYMFLHENIWHIFSNMLMLFFGGQLFIEYMGERRLLWVYLLGGITGAITYILVFNIFPVFSTSLHFSSALGASAAVLAIFVAIATYVPNFIVNLFFVFPVRLVFVAIGLVVLDLISIDKGNPGGHIAHLGGALFGFVYARQLQKGRDMSAPFSRMFASIASLFSRKGSMKVVYSKKTKSDMQYNANKKAQQQMVDDILDKISRSGYESLSKEEKEILFKFSKDH
jgi:membrane associated rhomboid family serine protease